MKERDALILAAKGNLALYEHPPMKKSLADGLIMGDAESVSKLTAKSGNKLFRQRPKGLAGGQGIFPR